MSEKFSLKWNDSHSHWKRSLSQIRGNNDFADVTIISEDKVKFMAHKVLLSSCSETFKFILKESNQAQSILYLSGVNSVNLKFILDYIYYGEVNLFQEQLESFLESAEKLEIQGLVGNVNASEDEDSSNIATDQHTINLWSQLPYNNFKPAQDSLEMGKNNIHARKCQSLHTEIILYA